MNIADLKPNPKNPRTITPEKLSMLKGALEEFGDLGGFVFNRKTGLLVGGHQRAKLFDKSAKINIEKKYSRPTKVGTVATGYVELKGERFSYREVEWDKTKEKAANIAANKGAGEWSPLELSAWVKEIGDFGFNLDLTMFDELELAPFLQDIEKINSGDENSEWAKMGDENKFKKGEEYITLAIYFQSEARRELFIKKSSIDIFRKTKNIWMAKL